MVRLAMKLMETVIGPRVAKWAARGLVLALAALAVFLAYRWAYDHGRDDERARWESAGAKIEAADAKADAAGTVTAAETKGKVDAGNERAKQAAAGSDDPLAAGFDSLRKENQPKGD